jgi:hypothetical protein
LLGEAATLLEPTVAVPPEVPVPTLLLEELVAMTTPVPVPLVAAPPELLAALPAEVPVPVPAALNITTGLSASGVPNPEVDAPEHAERAPSVSARHVTPIGTARFFMSTPDAGSGEKLSCWGWPVEHDPTQKRGLPTSAKVSVPRGAKGLAASASSEKIAWRHPGGRLG